MAKSETKTKLFKLRHKALIIFALAGGFFGQQYYNSTPEQRQDIHKDVI